MNDGEEKETNSLIKECDGDNNGRMRPYTCLQLYLEEDYQFLNDFFLNKKLKNRGGMMATSYRQGISKDSLLLDLKRKLY